jgi:hypothetical protein
MPPKEAGCEGVERPSRLHQIDVRHRVEPHALRDSLDGRVNLRKLVRTESNGAPSNMGHKGEMHDEEQDAEHNSVEETDDRSDGDNPEYQGHQQRQQEEGPFTGPTSYLNALMGADGGMRHAASRGWWSASI